MNRASEPVTGFHPGDSPVVVPEEGVYRPLNPSHTSWAHATALVDSHAEVGDGVAIGPYAVVGSHVTLGDGTQVGAHVVLDGWTRTGRHCRIFPFAVIGTIPQDLKFAGVESYVEIGDANTIREFVTINRATTAGGGTTIGYGNLLMAYVHIAHDCRIGDRAILANGVTLAGHVLIEDMATVGGLTPVHQFVRIGQQAFVGGASRVSKDVPPYIRAAGNPLRVVGLNSVGLQRRGMAPDVQLELKRAYRLLYRSHLNISQAMDRIRRELRQLDEIRHLLEFIENSSRGISI